MSILPMSAIENLMSIMDTRYIYFVEHTYPFSMHYWFIVVKLEMKLQMAMMRVSPKNAFTLFIFNRMG